MPDYSPFSRAQSLIGQTPGGSQIYQRILQNLNRQLGLRQRRQQMQGEQMNIPAHLRYAYSQQEYPELYGQYAGATTQAAAQAPGVDIQKAQALAGIQGQVEQLRMQQEQLDLMKRQQKQAESTSFWDVLGGVGSLGLGVAGLLFPPAGIAGAALGAGSSIAGSSLGASGLGMNFGNAGNWMMNQFQQNNPGYGVPPIYQPAGGY